MCLRKPEEGNGNGMLIEECNKRLIQPLEFTVFKKNMRERERDHQL